MTKLKGDSAQLIIASRLMRDGYRVAFPYGEDWKLDLIVLKGGKLERVQCKYVESRGQSFEVRCRSCNNWKVTRYTFRDIDWIIVFDRDTDKCYYIPAAMLGRRGRNMLKLRIAPAKNHQSKLVRFAQDFETW